MMDSDRIAFGNTFRDFEHQNLNKPGTLIWINDFSEPYLIGNINPLGGVCNDCCDVRYGDVVDFYKVVWTPETQG
jgi:hypothetical protein